MKYRLINAETGEEHLCQKIVIDGFDYYVSGEIQIATNNPNYNTPKVVDEAYELSLKMGLEFYIGGNYDFENGVRKGYKKSQETHPFSEDDMIEFLDFSKSTNQRKTFYELVCLLKGKPIESSEILKLWKEQKTQTIYFR